MTNVHLDAFRQCQASRTLLTSCHYRDLDTNKRDHKQSQPDLDILSNLFVNLQNK